MSCPPVFGKKRYVEFKIKRQEKLEIKRQEKLRVKQEAFSSSKFPKNRSEDFLLIFNSKCHLKNVFRYGLR